MRLALTAAEVGSLLLVSDQHVVDQAGELGRRGVPVVVVGGCRLWRAVDVAVLVDGPGAPLPDLRTPLVWRVTDVAGLLGIPVRAVHTAIDHDQIPGVVRLGRCVRVSRAQLAAHLGASSAVA
jgi:hypothetical protein